MNLIEQAKLFATQKHVLDNRQLYGNLLPYTHHLQAVEAVLVRFGFADFKEGVYRPIPAAPPEGTVTREHNDLARVYSMQLHLDMLLQ